MIFSERNIEFQKFREPIQVKDAVLFSPKDKEMLIEALQMDTYEPPMTQVHNKINECILTGSYLDNRMANTCKAEYASI